MPNPSNDFGFTDKEWSLFSEIEKKIITLSRQFNVSDHKRMRELLNWPLPYPKNEKTYKGQWSRLMAKMRKINEERLIS